MKKTQDANVVGKIHHTIKNEFVRERQRIAKQFPLGFTLAVAFGVSLVFSGVNGIIQHVSFLKNNLTHVVGN